MCADCAEKPRRSCVFARTPRVGRGPLSVLKLHGVVSDVDDAAKYLDPIQRVWWGRDRKMDNSLRALVSQASLEGLPQFLYVLKGDMSAVGPKFIMRDELAWFDKGTDECSGVSTGAAGFWQTVFRKGVSFESDECQCIEPEYVRGAWFAMDARCFLDIFGVMFGRRRSGR